MGVREGKVMDGMSIIMWSIPVSAFRWSLDGNLVRAKEDPKLCLSVREGKAGDGADIILWSCHSDKVQHPSLAALFTVSGDHLVYKADEHYCLSVREAKVT